MAHVQKYTKGNIQGLSIHWDRKTENHSNLDIDNERSDLNYDLCEKEGDTLSRMNQRLSEVHAFKRNDLKVCADWVVTLPESLKEISEKEQREFFEKTYEFLANRYGGEKNVLSANVHMDETTPHMHFAFMPVVWDEKKQREKVSAKEVLTRKELKTFHQDLDIFLKQEIPHIYKEGILNDKTIGVDTVKDLKKHSEEIQKQKDQQKADATAEMKVFKEPKQVLKKIEASAKKTMFGDKVTLPSKDFEKLKDLSVSSMKVQYQAEKRMAAATGKIEELEEKYYEADRRADNAEFEFGLLEKEVDKLKKYRTDAIVYKSILQDTNRHIEIGELEKKGRLVLFNLENGHEPKNQKEGQQWLSILEENKKAKIIPQKRLEAFIERLKAFLDKITRERERILIRGLKTQIRAVKTNETTKDKER
ncbi:MobV family relaxase [Bacillus thuringiensis]|uniref:MobV family relaxase n=3 Tax=Bacillus cereus group TaxID=86661 RepID=UPI00211DFBBA|nr:MobV family relaxase [Bacillus thuringiensis]